MEVVLGCSVVDVVLLVVGRRVVDDVVGRLVVVVGRVVVVVDRCTGGGVVGAGAGAAAGT